VQEKRSRTKNKNILVDLWTNFICDLKTCGLISLVTWRERALWYIVIVKIAIMFMKMYSLVLASAPTFGAYSTPDFGASSNPSFGFEIIFFDEQHGGSKR